MANCVLPLLSTALGLLIGLFLGIYDTKRTYGIPHKIPPEDCEVIVHGRDNLDC